MEARVARVVLCVLAMIAGVVVGTTAAIGAAAAAQPTDPPVGGDGASERLGGATGDHGSLAAPGSNAPGVAIRQAASLERPPAGRLARGNPTNWGAALQGNESDPGGGDGGNGTAGAENGTDAENGTAENETTIDGYDEVHVGIALQGNNGTATWTVQYRYRLDAENGSDAWRTIRQDVAERPERYIERFEERWSDDIDRATNATGREMDLSNFAVAAENATGVQEYGFVTFTFRWSSFAHVEINRIEAGDALEGFVLDDRTQLVVTWPEAYNATAVEPEPDDRRETAVIWTGTETEFVEGEPRVGLMRDEGDPNATAGDGGDGLPVPWLAALGVAFLAIAGVTGWWVRTDRAAGTGEGAAGNGTNGVGLEGGEGGGAGGPPPELLSNEERVLRLLRENGGRIKQQAVVSELDWTEAKTSQVVGDLREAGRIEVFRIGRENVLSLPATEGDSGADVNGGNFGADVNGGEYRSDGNEDEPAG